MNTRMLLATGLLCVASMVPALASADPWEVRREQREAAREIRRCTTPQCVRREMREGQREIKRERREARQESRREWAEEHYRAGHGYGYNARQYPDRYIRTVDRNAHFHRDGHYCRDGRHILHLSDGYYRGDRRWYRDGRYWNEYDYVTRYYRGNDWQRDNDDDDDLVRGIAIGAAVVGVIAAIHEANDDD